MLPQPPQTTAPNIEDIWAYISAVDADLLLSESEFPVVADAAYSRLTLLKEPFEVTLIRWPVGGKSAIHKHDGFYGAVRVLKGGLVNRVYEHHSAVLEETEIVEFTAGGIVEEADGTIHLLENSSEEESISLHVYYPCIVSFEGMHLYNIEEGAIGVLGSGAQSASWKSEVPNHFKQIQQHVYEFKSITSVGSHYISPIVPKPTKGEILRELSLYYDEQAKQYDGNDLNVDWRKQYTEGVNKIIAVELMKRQVDDYLAICCGTGRRPLEIKALTGKDFKIYGVDISEQMVAESEKRGLITKCGDITNVQFGFDQTYDCITYLYAFGHLTCREDRLEVLRKCKKHLNPGGVFFADLFCLRNIFEWGGAIQKLHEKYSLEEQGYNSGDIFYKRYGGQYRAFLHYFTREEILALFQDAGFEFIEIQKIGYTNRSGQLHDTSDEGMYWVKAW
jgi:ubiquinone/menaquinone biosynthesis C-methylase UbiE